MTTTELLALFRSEVFDLELPYLWSDALVYGYIDDAQKQFCRDTVGIADARNFTVDILPGTDWYDIDPRILKIRGATDRTTGLPIPLMPVEKMYDSSMRFDGNTGLLKALIAGLEENVLRAWPSPAVASTVELTTFRLPTTVEAGDDLEIDPRHHRYLLHWVKYLAYDVQDTETYDKNASDKNRAKHEAYCAKAIIEQSRARHSAASVIYGGI